MRLFLMIFSALILLPLFSANAGIEKEAKDTTKAASAKAKVTADAKEEKAVEKKTDSTTTKKEPEMITTESGLRYQDLKVGTGEVAVKNMKVKMHYTLWHNENDKKKGKALQSSLDSNKPLAFTVGQAGLIAGWNEGAEGMKVGGKRKLYIPSKLGYGAKGRGKMIPPNTDLIFELIFVKVVK